MHATLIIHKSLIDILEVHIFWVSIELQVSATRVVCSRGCWLIDLLEVVSESLLGVCKLPAVRQDRLTAITRVVACKDGGLGGKGGEIIKQAKCTLYLYRFNRVYTTTSFMAE